MQIFFGVLRALLAGLSGFLVALGLIEEEAGEALIEQTEVIIGALGLLATIGWSAWEKWQRRQEDQVNSPLLVGVLVVAVFVLAACDWSPAYRHITPEGCAALDASEAPFICRPGLFPAES
jgi:hypothetical protein